LRILKSIGVGLAGLVVLYLLLAFLAPSVHVTVKREMNQSIEKSFRTLINPFQFGKWIPGFRSIKPLTGDLTTPASKNVMLLNINDKDYNVIQTITKYEKNKTFGFDSEIPQIKVTTTIIMESMDGKTKMTVKMSFIPRDFLIRPILLFGRRRIVRTVDKVFDDLATLVESGEGHSLFY
jgi:hypothetical protein